MQSAEQPTTSRIGLPAVYIGTVAVFSLGLWAVLGAGRAMFGDTVGRANHVPDGIGAALARGLHAPLGQLLLQLIVIVATAKAFGGVFRRIGQPAVVGEMFAGLALGPSCLGLLAPGVSDAIFPRDSLGAIQLLSQVGVILFMFGVGLELDTALVRRNARSAVLVSHTGIIFPFLLGAALALLLFRDYAGLGTPFPAFCLFLGISMSVTAFPVLARILQERGLTRTPLGATAIACAAIGDVTAWCALAFVVAIAGAQNMAGAFVTVVLIGVFVVCALLFGRVLARQLARETDPARPSDTMTVACLIALFCGALATEALGIHALFGAFLAGIAMPKDDAFRAFLRARLEYFGTLFLLPVFFAFTGLRTQVGLLDTAASWGMCLLVIAVAVIGKAGSGYAAARLVGQPRREAAALGVLMNTRGLMELIVLNLGLDLGVLSPRVFPMLVLMALVTTFATGPLLSALGYRSGSGKRSPEGSPETAGHGTA